ncbi:hypothetical protein JYU19_01820 [bacterium AH-315-J21]|nr:hypothetical protein [bacterium AH-315-J21]
MKKTILCVMLVSLALTASSTLFGRKALAQETEKETISAPIVRELTGDEFEINAVLQEIFWRVKANDNSAFYENEFSYLRQDITLDKYLKGVRFNQIPKANSDSIAVLTLDSAIITGDTAKAFLTLTVGLDEKAPLRYMKGVQLLYHERGRWIKPISTNSHDNDIFYQNLEEYRRGAEEESGD